MTHDEAQSIVNLVCWKFGVAPAKLDWRTTGTKAKNGVYFPHSKTIQTGPHSWRGVENTLIHELAHHLTPVVYRQKNWSQHGKEFQLNLLKVANFWFGDWRRYAWHTEYKRLQSYGRKK